MLANQIKNLRKKAGMSQLQLAEKLNVGPSAIGMYEQGRRMPAVEMLIEIANLFDVSLDYLITGREISNLSTDGMEKVAQSACPCRVCCFCCKKYMITQIAHCRNEDDLKCVNR